MPNAVHKFKDRDVRRLLKLTRETGAEIAGVQVNPRTGDITIHTSKSNPESAPPPPSAPAPDRGGRAA